jgi:hypothetical protein
MGGCKGYTNVTRISIHFWFNNQKVKVTYYTATHYNSYSDSSPFDRRLKPK